MNYNLSYHPQGVGQHAIAHTTIAHTTSSENTIIDMGQSDIAAAAAADW
jgi:hypothetical protein